MITVKPKLKFEVMEVRKTIRPNSSKSLRPPKRRPQVGRDL